MRGSALVLYDPGVKPVPSPDGLAVARMDGSAAWVKWSRLVPTIHLHRKRAAVFVPEPTTDGGNIDAGFDTPGREQVS